MNDYIITCCSTADMPREHFIKRRIPYVCFHFMIDGKEYLDDLGESMSLDEFYTKIKNGALPTTSQVNVSQFVDFFEPYLKIGLDILHISTSSGLSGEFNSANIAKNILKDKYPDRKIEVIDSISGSSGYGLLVDAAADLRDSGKSLGEVYEWVLNNRGKINHWFYFSDMAHLKHGGRISSVSALAGTVLNIFPLFYADAEGKLASLEKPRGKKKVLNRMLVHMLENAEGGKYYSGKCYISHSACFEDAKMLADMVQQVFVNLTEPVKIFDMGTVIGSHAGCGATALFFLGNDRNELK